MNCYSKLMGNSTFEDKSFKPGKSHIFASKIFFYLIAVAELIYCSNVYSVYEENFICVMSQEKNSE